MKNPPSQQLINYYQNSFKGPINFDKNVQEATDKDKNYTNKLMWEEAFQKDKEVYSDWTSSVLAFQKRIYPGKDRVLVYDYVFGDELSRQGYFEKDSSLNQKQQLDKKLLERLRKENEYNRDFDFIFLREKHLKEKNISNIYKKRRMTLKDISLIGQKQYQTILNETDMGPQICELSKQKPQKKVFDDESLMSNLAKFHYHIYKPNKKNSLISTLQNGYQYRGSEQFGINIFKDLSINQQLCIENVPLDHHQLNYIKIMQLSKGGFTIKQLNKLRNQNLVKINQSKKQQKEFYIEQQVQQIKIKIKALLDKKEAKRRKSFTIGITQTDNQRLIIPNQAVDLNYDVYPILFKIQTLEDIKSNYVKNKAGGIILNQINNQINNQLFNLLIIIAHEETYINLAQLMVLDCSQVIENQIMKLFDKHMTNIEGKIYRGGQSKAEMLNFYINKKIQLVKQTNFLQLKAEAQSKQRKDKNIKKKTPTKNNISIKVSQPEDKKNQNIFSKTLGTPKQNLNGSFKFSKNFTPKKVFKESSNKQTTPETKNFNNFSLNGTKKMSTMNSPFRQISPFNRTTKVQRGSFQNTIDILFRSKKSPTKNRSISINKKWK